MTDQENATGGSAGLSQLWLAQLRRTAKGLAGMTGPGQSVLPHPVPSLPGLPRPGALSAAQLNSIASGVAAQRRSIAALQAQLAAFDEQLAALERIVGLLAGWGKVWAQSEGLVMNARTRARGLLITRIWPGYAIRDTGQACRSRG